MSKKLFSIIVCLIYHPDQSSIFNGQSILIRVMGSLIVDFAQPQNTLILLWMSDYAPNLLARDLQRWEEVLKLQLIPI
ncbi:unnamed protein product [Ambrosiozyma monospora]|uniref:Unnamed protein product n=1 Tax=Ambrosiozyma monospora TaxID=43982 RepID=A0ACB5TYP9_AMBMO|nr:unnamed protein product [Ambrosiozyma monospora]